MKSRRRRGLLLASVVVIVPLFSRLKLSPVLGFLGIGLALNRAGLFIENQEVDQFCELGIQFLLFEMGLELSSVLSSLAKYAFGLGLTQVLLVNLVFAAALLPAGDALGTKVLEFVQPGTTNCCRCRRASSRRHRIRAVALVLGVRVTALGGSEDVDDEIRDGEFRVTAVSRFSRRAVHHLVARVADAARWRSDGADVPMLAAGGATSFLDLGALAFGGRQIALLGFRAICKENCTNDVFVAMSLLVLFGLVSVEPIGFSDSLGAFLAGIILADTPYSHTIIRELQAFKGLFLSLFFVTIGTTIDLPLFIELWPIALLMTVHACEQDGGDHRARTRGGIDVARSARRGRVFVSRGEFAFVIFGQATSGSTGSLFPMDWTSCSPSPSCPWRSRRSPSTRR